MAEPSTHLVTIACGVAGAYVDVSAYVLSSEGIDRAWGKQSDFDDTAPGTFSLTLNNGDGRFTPGNTASALATPLVEGMDVCWQVGTRLVHGKIRTFDIRFPSMVSELARVQIVCDDMLGAASRSAITLTAQSMVLGAKPYLYWPFDDAVGSTLGTEQSGNLQPPFDSSASGFGPPTFGYAAIPYIGDTQVVINDAANVPFQTSVSPALSGQTLPGRFATINYATGSMGTWGAWFTALASPASTELFIRLNGFNLAGSSSFRFGINSSGSYWLSMGSNTLTSTVPVVTGVPAYLQMVVTNSGSSSITAELYINGVSQGTCVWAGTGGDPNGLSTNYQRTPQFLSLSFGAAGAVAVSHLSHTPLPVPEYVLGYGTEAGLITATAATTFGITLASLPSGLAISPASPLSGQSSSLSKLNDVIRSEQGYIYTATTGTSSAPVEKIVVRERARPPSSTVAATFDILTDVVDAPELVRSLADTLSSVTVAGPSSSTLVADSTLFPLVGSATRTEDVVLNNSIDLVAWGQDRLIRAKFTQPSIRVASFVVDAFATDTDRWALLASLVPGDRIRLTSLPSTQLGFSTWDGWLIGGTEHHTEDQHSFTFYVARALPDTGIYDTDLYANGGNNTISTTLTNVATSMKCTSADVVTLFETSAVNYYLQVDSEVVKVTACSAPVAGVQTLTITRAQFSTAAASHAVGVVPEVYADSTGRLNNGIYAF